MFQEFSQAVEETARSVMEEIHTALPAHIVSLNPQKAVATVQPVGSFSVSEDEMMDYPEISDVPLVMPFCQSENCGVFYPVKKGDSCLVIISEVELDAWRSSVVSGGELRFDLTSAIAIPGLLRTGGDQFTEACRRNEVIIASGGTKITLSNGSASISGNLFVQGSILYTGTIQKQN